MALFDKFLPRRRPRTSPARRRETVLIVGGSRGLGLDLARTYAARGAQVALCARDPDEVERARAELADAGSDVFAATCDAAAPQQVQEFVSAIVEHFGTIDVLVTCAATIQVGPLDAMDLEDFAWAMQQIFWTTYHPTMAVLPHMRRRGAGTIVHITSFGGRLAIPHLAPYSTAKFAATGFSAGLRAELARDGIRVTTVTPGLLRTGAHLNAPIKGQHEKEYAWFAAGATLPLLSLPARTAAERIVRAADRGKAECTLGLSVRAAIILQAVAPELTARLLALQARLLPAMAPGGHEAMRGMDVAAASESPVIGALDDLGRENATVHHAYPGPINVEPWLRRERRLRWS